MGLLDSLNGAVDSVVDTIQKNGLDQTNPLQLSQGLNSGDADDLASLIVTFQEKTRELSTATSIMSRGLRFDYISADDWNKVYPYSFMILTLQGGKYVLLSNLQITLPITPMDLSVGIPFASTTTVTSRGIMEENNGAPLRNISFTASTGVFMKRPSFAQTTPDHSFIGTVFAGTIGAINQVGSAFSALAGSNITATGGNKLPSEDLVTSGYYQYHMIRSFLELYADMKKRPEGAQYRLAFQMAKDKVTYLITPQMFVPKRSAASPLEYIYTFQGLAWGTVTKDQIQFDNASDGPSAGSQSLVNDVGDYQRALNAMRNLRGVIQKAKDVITAIKTDVDVNLIGPLNNVILALKEAISIPATIADLPNEIQKSLQQNVIRQAQNLFDQIPLQLRSGFTAAAAASTSTPVSNKQPVSLSSSSASSTGTGSFNVDVATQDKVLLNIDFTDSISVDSLQLTKAQQDAITDATVTALSITNNDINDLVSQIQSTVAALDPVAVQQGDESPIWPITYALQECQTEMYALLSSNTFATTSTAQQQTGVTPLIQFYQATTAAQNINFVLPQSKMAIPFPFKVSLERLAQQYLGDASRWIEIVAVNNLKPPYIDEDGFTYPFLSNGNGNQFNVATIQNLFLNQDILIGSNTQNMEPRKIQTIQQISDTNFLVSVSGDQDLSDFKLGDQAFLKAYLPNTVNSQKMIFIPLEAPANVDNTQSKILPFQNVDPNLVRLSKIDILLDQNGDVACTQDGTIQIAFGASNLIQAAKLKMSAAAGQIILHPSYGAAPEVGESIADLSVTDIRNRIIDSFKKDERFGGVKNLLITENEDAIEIGLTVPVATTGTDLPLNFQIDS